MNTKKSNMVRSVHIPIERTIEVFGTDEFELRVLFMEDCDKEVIDEMVDKHEVCWELTNLKEDILCIKLDNKVNEGVK